MSVSAMLGQSVVVRNVRGQCIVTNRRIRRHLEPTKGQKAMRNKFHAASDYAKGQLAIPKSAEMYTRAITPRKRSAYLVAMSDFLNAPKVHEIDARSYRGHVGDIIRIKATDDFMVTDVKVIIVNPRGEEIETGEAVADSRHVNTWKYRVSVENPDRLGTIIRAKACDRPMHWGEREIQLSEEEVIIPQIKTRPNFLSSLLKGITNWLTRT